MVQPQDNKIKAIRDDPRPSTRWQMIFSRFVCVLPSFHPDFSSMAFTLTELTKREIDQILSKTGKISNRKHSKTLKICSWLVIFFAYLFFQDGNPFVPRTSQAIDRYWPWSYVT